MKYTRPLIAFAYLSDKFDETRGDIVQGLIPIFGPLIKARAGKTFDPEEFSQAISEHFGIKIHPWALEDWSLRLEKAGYLEIASRTYEHVVYRYSQVKDETPSVAEEDVSSLVSEFLSYAESQLRSHDMPVDRIRLEKEFFDRLVLPEFLNIIRKPDKRSVSSQQSNTTLRLSKAKDDPEEEAARDFAARMDVLCADFILHISTNNQVLFDLLVRITNGALIAEVVLNFQAPGTKADFSGLRAFLDAPLIMDLLGLGSGESNEYAKEFFEQLQRSNATQETFSHCISEIENNLDSALEKYKDGRAYGPTGSRLRDAGFRSYVVAVRKDVKEAVKNLKIKVADDCPNGLYQYFTEDQEVALRNTIGFYEHSEARNRDALSVGNIIRFRRGVATSTNEVRGWKVIFVTENARLARLSTSHLNTNKYLKRGEMGPVITDRYMAGVLWVSEGGKGADLSRKRLLANCAAAVSPRQDVISKMHGFLTKLDEQKAQFFEALMTDHRAEHYLMRLTLGDATLVTEKNFPDIYERLERIAGAKVAAEKDVEMAKALETLSERMNKEIAQVTGEKGEAATAYAKEQAMRRSAENQLRQRERAVLARCVDTARKAQRRAVRGIFLGVALITGIGAVFNAFGPKILPVESTGYLVLTVTLILLTIISSVLSFWSVPDKLFLPLVARYVERVFHKKIQDQGAQEFVGNYVINISEGSIKENVSAS